MKTFLRVIQLLTGVLFIVSGLVKANDPLGLSYKMQEFFELWSGGLASTHLVFKQTMMDLLDWLHHHCLALSILIITLEVAAGFGLLVVWKRNFLLNLLCLLIIFFTFLTGYAYLSGKFTNCGCFGDCFPISPLASFTKDVFLLIMIVGLMGGKKTLFSFLPNTKPVFIMLAGIAGVLSLQLYALNYLPLVDCLPFKVGNNIGAEMKSPAHARQDSFAIKFIYEKQGKRYEFTPENLPADFTKYKYIDRRQELIRKGNAEPAIKGFALIGESESDSTEQVLDQREALLLFLPYYLNEQKWITDFKIIVSKAHQQSIPVFIITSDRQGITERLFKAGVQEQIFTCDFTVLRTAARTTPTLYFLRKGTVFEKYSYRRFQKAADFLTREKN
ncbi:MAG: DoxX family protein [Flavisolibacter sp.]